MSPGEVTYGVDPIFDDLFLVVSHNSAIFDYRLVTSTAASLNTSLVFIKHLICFCNEKY